MYFSLKPTNVRSCISVQPDISKNETTFIAMDVIPEDDYLLKINQNTFCSDVTYKDKSYLGLGEKIEKGYLLLRNIKDLDKNIDAYDGIGEYRTGIFYFYTERNSVEIIIYLKESAFLEIQKKIDNQNLINRIGLQLSDTERLSSGEIIRLDTEYQSITWNIENKDFGNLGIRDFFLNFTNENEPLKNQINDLNKTLLKNNIDTNKIILDLNNEITSIKELQIKNHQTLKYFIALICILLFISFFK